MIWRDELRMPPQEDSPDEDAFIILDEQVERDNLHRKLMATARSLKKQKQWLKAALSGNN